MVRKRKKGNDDLIFIIGLNMTICSGYRDRLGYRHNLTHVFPFLLWSRCIPLQVNILLKIHAGPTLFLGNEQHFLILRETLMLLTGPCESTENHFIY